MKWAREVSQVNSRGKLAKKQCQAQRVQRLQKCVRKSKKWKKCKRGVHIGLNPRPLGNICLSTRALATGVAVSSSHIIKA